MIVKINRQIFNDNNFRSQAWKKFFWTSNILGSTYVLLKLLVYLSLRNSWYRTKKKKCWLIQRIFFNIWHPKILMSEIIAKIGKHHCYQKLFSLAEILTVLFVGSEFWQLGFTHCFSWELNIPKLLVVEEVEGTNFHGFLLISFL